MAQILEGKNQQPCPLHMCDVGNRPLALNPIVLFKHLIIIYSDYQEPLRMNCLVRV